MEVTLSEIEIIQELTSKNYSIKAIATLLGKDFSLFSILSMDENHPICKAIIRGKSESQKTKQDELIKRIESGSETAIQIHDKQSNIREFLDIKNDVFS